MSHTDKDAPDWVRAIGNPNAAIHHDYRCEHNPWYGLSHPTHTQPCDLGDTTHPRANRCFYYAADRTRWYTGTGPSRERRHLLYFGPERAAVRDNLRNALRDYNTYGDTDIEPPTRQNRRSTWFGGWWD